MKVARHPGAKWIGSIGSAVLAGVIVVVLTTGGPSGPTPSPAPTSPAAHTSPPDPLAGLTLTAAFIPELYSAANADGFYGLAPDDTKITAAMRRAQNCEDLHTMLAQAGAVDTGGTYIRLFFENATRLPAIISQVRARVVHESPARLGLRVQCTLGAGPLAPPKSAIELDSPTAVVQAVKVDPQNDLQWTPAGSFFQQQVVPLNPGKSFTLDVQVDPQTCTCSWTLAADVMIGGRTVTLTAQNGSQPFRTAPFPKQRGRECWALDFQAKVPHLAQTSPPC